MSVLDWGVMAAVIVFIVAYGMRASRGAQKSVSGYLAGDRSLGWLTIGLSVMATQASAITFLSTPGQAFGDSMKFVQFYLGMPVAMVVLCVTAIPIYHKLKVYTAYEYLENRFDLKTRALGALLFLVQRGMAAGLTISAPAIILSSVLGWDLRLTCVAIGTVVVFYTVIGGTKAVSYTQKQQMIVILAGMGVAGYLVFANMPEQVTFDKALHVAGAMGKLETVDFNFDITGKYNFWSGVLAATFLMLSYFGTDQSQVQRYLGGKSIAQSRYGLLMNAIVKIPMQFLILFLGAMLFVYYQFAGYPILFNEELRQDAYTTRYAEDFRSLEGAYAEQQGRKQALLFELMDAVEKGDEAQRADVKTRLEKVDTYSEGIRQEAVALLRFADDPDYSPGMRLDEEREKTVNKTLTKDRDFVFISFVLDKLPEGIVGLLIAVILSAAMSSAASELNALGSTTFVDIYRRMLVQESSDRHQLLASKGLTVLWGGLAIAFAVYASELENLIQAVNQVGSYVYGTILGIFLTAFYLKPVKGDAVFVAALLAQGAVVGVALLTPVGYLWYNVVGCLSVAGFAVTLQMTIFAAKE